MYRSHRALKVLLATIFSLSLLSLTALSAFAVSAHPTRPAHAKVISSDPAIGSTINKAPSSVTVTTAEEMNPDPTKTNLIVYGPGADATSEQISQGDAKVSLSDPTKMTVAITPTSGHADGVYVVVWKTVSSDDGDPASGAFTFTVNSSGTAPAPTTGSNQPATTSSSGVPTWVPIVAAVVALLVGLGAGLGLGRRARPASSIASLRSSVAEDLHSNEEAGKRS